MILMGQIPVRGKLEWARPFKWPEYGLVPIKIVKFKCHIKNRYIDNFMYMSFAAAVFCILYTVLRVVSFMCYSGPAPSPSLVS
jgi:hypothetical protein